MRKAGSLRKQCIRLLILCLLVCSAFAPAVFAASANVVPQKAVISPSRKSYVMVKGERLYLSIKGYSGTVTWKSGDRSIVTIGARNVIAAKAKGSVKLTGTYGKKKITLTVKVQLPVISPQKAVLSIGEKKQLKVTGTNQTIKWFSSDKKTAAVNKNGLVTAKNAGSSVVSAVIHGVKYSCEIGVRDANGAVPTPTPYPYVRVTSGQLKSYLNKVLSRYESRYYINSYANDLQTYPATAGSVTTTKPVPSIPAYASNDPRQFSNITWKNSNSAVASLSGTELKVKKGGTTTLTAVLKAKDGTSARVSKKITVTDMKKYYKTVTISQADMPKYFKANSGVIRNSQKVVTYLPKKISNRWILAGYASPSGQNEQFSMVVQMSNAVSSGTLTRTSSFTDSTIKSWNTDTNGKTTYINAYPSLFFEIPVDETVRSFSVLQMTNGKVKLVYVNQAALSKKKAGTSYGGYPVYSTIDGKAKVQVP